ncbi:MAG TPA: TIGR02300 family protein [Aliiroseovarius sp.]|nr:TIGR02300 family protein [Aliiroseovarius sp.]
MPKEEWGTKRICPTTGKRFYDLNRDPIISPYTGETVNPDTGKATRTMVADKADKASEALKADEVDDVLVDDDDTTDVDLGDDVLDDDDDTDDVPLEEIADVAVEDDDS